MRSLSPSRLDLFVDHCAFPLSPLAPPWPDDTRSADSTFGVAVHAVAECAAVWGDAPVRQIAEAYALGSEDRARLEACAEHQIGWLTHIATGHLYRRAELAIAYHVPTDTARELRCEYPRDYRDVRPGELPMTLDLVLRDGCGALEVADWKSGRHQMLLRAAASRQLKAYALGAARLFGVDAVTITLLHVSEDGIREDAHNLDAWDLDLVAAELRALYQRDWSREVPRPGMHCTGMYCPIRRSCPATTAALASIDAAAAPAFPLTATITSPEHAADVLVRLKLVEAGVERIKEALRQYAARQPIPVGPGRVWGQREHAAPKRITAQDERALEIIETRLGPFADEAIERKTSEAALERAARRMLAARGGKRGDLARTMRTLLDELHAAGAVTRGAPHTRFEEFAIATEEESDHAAE